jgi:hypothetical protein
MMLMRGAVGATIALKGQVVRAFSCRAAAFTTRRNLASNFAGGKLPSRFLRGNVLIQYRALGIADRVMNFANEKMEDRRGEAAIVN